MARIRLWHGSSRRIDAVDPEVTQSGGFHCGTREQAEMRGPRVLHEVELDIMHQKRARDTGGDWARKIAEARRRGYCAIVYLNRYEGIPVERIQALAASGDLGRLDRLSDAAFKRLVPEARDSYIILHAPDAKILDVIEEPCLAEPAPECDNALNFPSP